MKIVCERTGGFAGLTLRAEVDSAELSASELRKMEKLIKEAKLFDQPAKTEGSMPDQYQYDLTIEDEGRTHSIQTNDTAVSEETLELIDWVIKKAREKK
ncbi:MAG TPA: protealysin inhibitor emfourin [Blastocatellia bacterium]|nr:protealysin inhibitor emfourin [Blastocatellia bacterium]